MRHSRRIFLRRLASALLVPPALANASNGDTWRSLSRSLRFYVTSPAGGAVDLIARTIGQESGQLASINAAIHNIDGANGEIALNRFGMEPADGKTWLVTHDSPIVINPSFYPRRSADILDRLQPLAGVASNGFYLLVREEDSIRSFDDFIRETSRPEVPVTYGSGGVGTHHHLMMEDLAARRGLQLTHVPYRGNSPAVQGLVRGDVRLLMAGASSLSLVRAGKLRVIAVTAPTRMPGFADVPAIAEYVAGFQGVAWFAVFGSAGAPAQAMADMNALVREIVETRSYVQRLRDAGNLHAEYVDGVTLTERIHADRKRFADLIARLPAAAMNPPDMPK